jgi:hypothetical protein
VVGEEAAVDAEAELALVRPVALVAVPVAPLQEEHSEVRPRPEKCLRFQRRLINLLPRPMQALRVAHEAVRPPVALLAVALLAVREPLLQPVPQQDKAEAVAVLRLQPRARRCR